MDLETGYREGLINHRQDTNNGGNMSKNDVKQEARKGCKIKWTKGSYCLVRLDMGNPYECLGALRALESEVDEYIQMPRRVAMQRKAAQQAALAGNGGVGVINGLKKNPSILK